MMYPGAPHPHPPPLAMIKAVNLNNNNNNNNTNVAANNNNNNININQPPTMASPFFMDNLLHHQKAAAAAAAANFQSQFVNSQLHSYIQEQHHQFLMHQSQLRQQQQQHQQQQQVAKYAEDKDSIKIPVQQNSYSRNTSPVSEEGSDEEDQDNFEEGDDNKVRFRRPAKDFRRKKKCSPNGDPTEDSPRAEDFDSPSGSPRIKNEYSPNYVDYPKNYNNTGKDEPQEDGSDQESKSKQQHSAFCCSQCGSSECSQYYPACRLAMNRRFEEGRIYLRPAKCSDDIQKTPAEDSPQGPHHGGGVEEAERDKDGRLIKAADVVKRCPSTNLDGHHPQAVITQQKPVLKFSVSAILGQDAEAPTRSTANNAAKVGHHDGFPVQVSSPSGGGGVFALPLGGFSLAPIAKPIASRPSPYPPGHPPPPPPPPGHPHHSLHSLLAHCRHHPYLTVGGGGAGGPGPWGPGVGVGVPGGGFPWAGARGKPRRGMMRRAVFSDTQRRGLERRFQLQKYISKPDRKKLAEKLGLKDSQVKIWFQNRRMKWRNSKERELLASGGSREQTLPNKNNPHPDLSDAETDRAAAKLSNSSPMSPQSPEHDPQQQQQSSASSGNNDLQHHQDSSEYGRSNNHLLQQQQQQQQPYGGMMSQEGAMKKSYSLMAADDAAIEYDSDAAAMSDSDEEINVT